MTCRICLSVMVDGSENLDQLMGLLSQKKPDLVEFRLDNLSNFAALEDIAHKKTFPAIAADKSNRDAATTRKRLMTAASSGFEFIDLDLASPHVRSDVRQVKSMGSGVIVSFHDFSKTPSRNELGEVLDSEIKAGSDVCKVVTTALCPRDNLSILRFLEEESSKTRLVSFAMGHHGIASRILSPLFGAEFTFASLTEASKTADGQLTIDNLRSAWQLLGV
ncbi:MAG: type I 3-dehydroquinate dehydratase [Candidatus Bathyarchaeia archaeon]